MRFIGMMCIKNESQWIDHVLASLHFCDAILVMDDHSTDNTVEICRHFSNVVVVSSPFPDYHEGRNNTWLAAQIARFSPDWVVHLMGDEVLEKDTWAKIQAVNIPPDVNVLRVRVINLWKHGIARADHQWAKRDSPTFWRFPKGVQLTYYAMHCSLPEQIECQQHPHPSEPPIVPLWMYHLGYSSPTLRQQAYDFFMEHDPGRKEEYQHLLDKDPLLVGLN